MRRIQHLSSFVLLSAVAALIPARSAGAQTTWTVDPVGPADFTTIQAAVDASASGDTIQVGPGTYSENVVIDGKAIALASTDGPAATIIGGAGATDLAVITLANGSDGTVEGFSITGGNHQLEDPSKPYNPLPTGGGIDIQSSSPTIRGNWIHGNYAQNGGGGICATDSSPLIEKNRIFANQGGGGVGLRCVSSVPGADAPIVINNLIYANQWVDTSAGDSPKFGGGVAIRDLGALVFAGNTVWGNVVPQDGGGAAVSIEVTASGSPDVRLSDSIFWGNQGPTTLENVAIEQVSNSDIQGGGALVGSSGNIEADPLLVAPGNDATGDFHIQAASPCIGAGIPVAQLTDDIDGEARDPTAPDMGADEFVVPPPTDVLCEVTDRVVSISWTNGSPDYTEVIVLMDGTPLPQSPLPAGTTSTATDPLVPGTHAFVVRGLIGAISSADAGCSADVLLAPPYALSCVAAGGGYAVDLAWTNGTTYDSVNLLRDGAPLTSVGGSPVTYGDSVPGPGVYDYEVRGVIDGQESTGATCASVEVTFVPPVSGLGCAPNLDGTVALSWQNGSPDYTEIDVLVDGTPQDPLAGSATSTASEVLAPGPHTFIVRGAIGTYSSADAQCAVGVEVSPPSLLTCVPVPDSLLVQLSWTNGATYDGVTVLRDGVVLESLLGSPTTYDDTVPGPGSYAYEVRGIVGGLESTGSTCAAIDVTYVPPVANLQCVANADDTVTLGWQNGLATYTEVVVIVDDAIASPSTLPGDATSFSSEVLPPGPHSFAVRGAVGALASVDSTCAASILVGSPTDLSCTIGAGGDTVELSWTNARTYDSVTVMRNGVELAVLPGSPSSYSDAVTLPGAYSYEVEGTAGAITSDPASCGPVDVTYVAPVTNLQCAANADGTVTLTWQDPWSGYTGILVFVDGVVTPDSPLPPDATSATTEVLTAGAHAFAVRAAVSTDESADASCSTLVGVGAPTDLACVAVEGTLSVDLSWAPVGTYETITVQRDGLVVAALGGTETAFTDTVPAAGSYSYDVIGNVGGLSTAAASCGPVDVVTETLPAPEGLQCTVVEVMKVRLAWTNPVAYDEIEVRLDGESAGLLDGAAQTVDVDLAVIGDFMIEVIGRRAGALDSVAAVCQGTSTIRAYVRGDANDDGMVNIADGIFPLNYLFRGGPAPPCFAAADANGDDKFDLSDPIWAINYLFAGGTAPPAPFPACGIGDTPTVGQPCLDYSSCGAP